MSVIVTPSLPTSEDPDASPGRETMQGAPTQYHLGRRLGAGGMAEVHLCTIEGLEGFSRQVAVKVVREAFAEEPKFCEMFNSEARLAARLNHPNIVSVTDYNRDEKGRPFLAMEYVEGVDLSRLMYGPRPLPFSVVAFLAVEILRGLGYAHAPPRESGIRGLVHRDISPQNVLLSWEGAVKVSDFGIAKALTSSGLMSGSHMGKPAYMSPEQVDGDRVDHRSDLYAVGVMLWEMLTGRQLFDHGRAREIFAQIILGNIARPGQVRAEVPADLEHVAMTLLQGDPAQRYARAEDAIAALITCNAMPRHGPGELIALLAERFHRRARGDSDEPVILEEEHTDPLQPIATVQTLTDERLAVDAPLVPPALLAAARASPRSRVAPAGATSSSPLLAAPLAVDSDSGGSSLAVASPPRSLDPDEPRLAAAKRPARVATKLAATTLVVVVVAVGAVLAAREWTASKAHPDALAPTTPPVVARPPQPPERTPPPEPDRATAAAPVATPPATPAPAAVRRTSAVERPRGRAKPSRDKTAPSSPEDSGAAAPPEVTEAGMVNLKIAPTTAEP